MSQNPDIALTLSLLSLAEFEMIIGRGDEEGLWAALQTLQILLLLLLQQELIHSTRSLKLLFWARSVTPSRLPAPSCQQGLLCFPSHFHYFWICDDGQKQIPSPLASRQKLAHSHPPFCCARGSFHQPRPPPTKIHTVAELWLRLWPNQGGAALNMAPDTTEAGGRGWGGKNRLHARQNSPSATVCDYRCGPGCVWRGSKHPHVRRCGDIVFTVWPFANLCLRS